MLAVHYILSGTWGKSVHKTKTKPLYLWFTLRELADTLKCNIRTAFDVMDDGIKRGIFATTNEKDPSGRAHPQSKGYRVAWENWENVLPLGPRAVPPVEKQPEDARRTTGVPTVCRPTVAPVTHLETILSKIVLSPGKVAVIAVEHPEIELMHDAPCPMVLTKSLSNSGRHLFYLTLIPDQQPRPVGNARAPDTVRSKDTGTTLHPDRKVFAAIFTGLVIPVKSGNLKAQEVTLAISEEFASICLRKREDYGYGFASLELIREQAIERAIRMLRNKEPITTDLATWAVLNANAVWKVKGPLESERLRDEAVKRGGKDRRKWPGHCVECGNPYDGGAIIDGVCGDCHEKRTG
jgi:hypothetical protein